MWPSSALSAIVAGMYGPGNTTSRLGTIALGAVLVFLAVAMVSKYIIRPLAGLLGWPLQKLAPVSGRLARDNTVRNPGRTAATASALMIGLGVVVFVAVFAQGLKSSFIDSFDKVVRADFIVQGTNFMPLPNDTTDLVEGVAGVETAAGVDAQQAQVAGKTTPVYAVDPSVFGSVWDFDWLKGGSDALLDRARPGRGPGGGADRVDPGHHGGRDGRRGDRGRQARQAQGDRVVPRPDDAERRHRERRRLRGAVRQAAAVHGVREERPRDPCGSDRSEPHVRRWPRSRPRR